MDNETILIFLKANLEIANDLQDSYLDSLILAAEDEITREGITLTDAAGDINLVVMYAAYLYRKRAEDTPVMPRMLRYALNNRVFAEKVSG